MATDDPKPCRALVEPVTLVPYDPVWPARFAAERDHLRACLPRDLLRRIEHVGSTAVPGLAAEPIIDLLVEVTDLDAARRRMAPILQGQGYECSWPPCPVWCIQRDTEGRRTHHLHLVEASSAEREQRLQFRDWLRAHRQEAVAFEACKRALLAQSTDRVAYAQGKAGFLEEVMARARGVPLPLRGLALDGANVIATGRRSAIARLDLAIGWCRRWRPDLPLRVFVDHTTLAVSLPAVQQELQARAAAGEQAEVPHVLCPPGQPADVPLLQWARAHRALVVSNDRFFDHEDLRKNVLLVQFALAAGKFTPQTEATWFRSPGLAVWVPLADLQRRA